MNLNTIRLTGVLSVKDTLGAAVTTEKVQLDPLVGAHSFCESIQTFVGGQSIDLVMQYPRLVKMLTSATKNPADMFSSEHVCELKSCSNTVAQEVLRGETVPEDQATPINRSPDFSFKPVIAINQTSGNSQLNYSKSGDVRVVVTLARNNNTMFGLSVVDGYSYALSDLRLEYTSYPDNGDMSPITYIRRQGLKQSFASNSAQLNFSFPMLANKVYGSYLYQADENVAAKNTLALQKPPSVSSLSFFWNNSTNEYISYQLRAPVEILDRYMDAIDTAGRNSTSLSKVANNNGYGIGLHLQEYVDLMSTKLSVVCDSGLPSNQPMILHLFAEGVGQL
jgi:hypothetical protein